MESVHETSEDAGNEVIITRVLDQPVAKVWDVLMTDEGSEILLGPGAHLGMKGSTWKSHDGSEGVIRSFHPLESIRFSWRFDQNCSPSMVEVSLESRGDQTAVTIKHDNVQAQRRDWIEQHWAGALDRIETECF